MCTKLKNILACAVALYRMLSWFATAVVTHGLRFSQWWCWRLISLGSYAIVSGKYGLCFRGLYGLHHQTKIFGCHASSPVCLSQISFYSLMYNIKFEIVGGWSQVLIVWISKMFWWLLEGQSARNKGSVIRFAAKARDSPPKVCRPHHWSASYSLCTRGGFWVYQQGKRLGNEIEHFPAFPTEL